MFEYTINKKRPIFTDTTCRAMNETDLFENIATIERYKKYNGKSDSMMDHIYDKLLRLGSFPIRNSYFDQVCAERIKPIIEFTLLFAVKYPTTAGQHIHINTDDERYSEQINSFTDYLKEFIKSHH